MPLKDILSQDVIVPDLLVTELRDRVYAEGLMSENGVRLHFGIYRSEMPYHRCFRDNEMGGMMWRFSSKPFKELTDATE